jgi:hypothetical protein
MENNENFVDQTEKVETTTEESQQVKTYTQEEVNDIVGRRLARQEARIRKDVDREYGELVEVLKAGTGKESIGDITETFRDHYQKRGVPLKSKPTYTDEDMQILANAEASEIISAGYDDVVDEVDRLTKIGEKMTPKEKMVFKALAEHRQKAENGRELSKIGVTEDVYNSDEFNSFAKQFNANTPITDIYEIYRKTQPKKDIQTMGSMKTGNSGDNGIKDFYTVEEARRFTKKDFDENPALFAAVEKSMQRWK